MNSNITSSLGAGSGINVGQLVRDLAAASREPKVARVNDLLRQNQARLSAVAQARSDLDGLANSLAQMVSDGTLRSAPSVSDATVLAASAAPGLVTSDLSASIEVVQLARGQSLVSGQVASRTAAIGMGNMTLTVNGTPTPLVIDASNNSLDGLAAAINASGAGLRATIVPDTGGFRLIVKGPPGAANGFTLTPDAGADPALSAFATGGGGGMSVAQTAANSIVKVDGVQFERSGTEITDLVPGLVISLKKAAPGQPVAIAATRPNEAIRQAVGDFVDVFNQLKANIKAAIKTAGGEAGLRQLDSDLAGIANRTLSSDPAISRLADIGVASTRDGVLALDRAKLDTALAANPEAVEALFNPVRSATRTAATDPGLAGLLDSVRDRATDSGGTLERTNKSLTARQQSLTDALAKIETREAAYASRLERQYGALDLRVGALRATQAYLTQQIEIWNNSNN